ncbi:hypothetical protein [Salibacterium halotolerans]|uniref:hypothetical protein n=1 Tax=Salibacterium halotolerans TaxID=1884432 RepID=UPI001481AA23|nr:hypothetical protein [Salibacterium halotolerans]
MTGTTKIILLLLTVLLISCMPKSFLRGLRRTAIAAVLQIPFLRRALLGAFLH